jgi:hypothetical protein
MLVAGMTTICHRGIVDYITEIETRNLTPRMPLHTNRDNAVLRKTFRRKNRDCCCMNECYNIVVVVKVAISD